MKSYQLVELAEAISKLDWLKKKWSKKMVKQLRKRLRKGA